MSTTGTAALLPLAGPGQTTRFVLGRLRRHRAAVVATLVTSAGAALSAVTVPRLVGRCVDVVATGGGRAELWHLSWLIVLAGAAQGLFTALAWAQVGILGQRVLAGMREDVMGRVLDLPAGVTEAAGSGDTVSRVADDVEVTAQAVNLVVPNLAQVVFLVGFTLAAMVALSPWLLLMVLVVVPVYALAARWYLPRSGRLYRQERVALGARAQGLLGVIQGAETVQAYAVEEHETRRVAGLSRTASVLGVQVTRLTARVTQALGAAENVALAAVLLLGYVVANHSGIRVGTVTAACLYLVSLFVPLMMIIFSLDEVQSAAASLSRMVGVITAEEVVSTGTARPRDASIELVGVRHAHTSSDGATRDVLAPVDLRVAAGEHVALVGSSGAGKSTLAAIMAGRLTPTAGTVRHGGVDLTQADPETVRTGCVMVSQDVYVFNGTLADDLRLATPGATDDDVRAALETAGAWEWVAQLPGGVDTVVGEQGHVLTAEQAQQVALARVALCDPRMVVLDEATAEDGSTGADVLQQAVTRVTHGRTTVVVAHRLSQAVDCDRILFLDHGRVVEDGPHDALAELGGQYAQLWRAWSGETPDMG